MTDYPDFPPNDWDDEGDENPLQDAPGYDDEVDNPDPYELVTQNVMETLGIESFDDIIFEASAFEPDELRGNRFTNLQEAITYLFDSGILRFSGVVLEDDEIKPGVKKKS